MSDQKIDKLQAALAAERDERLRLSTELAAVRAAQEEAERMCKHLIRVIAMAARDIDDGEIKDARDLLDDDAGDGGALPRYEREILERELAETRQALARALDSAAPDKDAVHSDRCTSAKAR